MQLILIIQVSIALLAGELAGSLPLGAWVGAACLAAAPALVLAAGVLLASAAHRGMDRGDRRGVERFYGVMGMLGWPVTLALAVAACSALPTALVPTIGQGGVAVLLMASAVASALLGYAATWGIERRIRESTLMRGLDGLMPLHPMPSLPAYVLAQARAGLLPMLVPLVVPVLLSEGARAVAVRFDPDLADVARIAGGVAGALLLFVLVPLIVPPLLGLRRLGAGSMRDDLEELARHAGIGVREIWVWPTDGLVANAAVMGVLPGLRCVMLSDCLLECMPREQVRAVMAHELGHVVRRHLPWMLAVILACWTLAGMLVTPLAQELFERAAAELPEAELADAARSAGLLRDAAVLVVGLAMFGFASRRFERQADTYAVQLLSSREGREDASPQAVDAMVTALGSVALLNHVPPVRGSWRHGSIAWRQDYLRALVGRAHGALAIDGLMAALRWGALAVVGAGIVLGSLPL